MDILLSSPGVAKPSSKYAWCAPSTKSMAQAILSGKFRFAERVNAPESAKDLIQSLLHLRCCADFAAMTGCYSPEERPGPVQIRAHSFFTVQFFCALIDAGWYGTGLACTWAERHSSPSGARIPKWRQKLPCATCKGAGHSDSLWMGWRYDSIHLSTSFHAWMMLKFRPSDTLIRNQSMSSTNSPARLLAHLPMSVDFNRLYFNIVGQP